MEREGGREGGREGEREREREKDEKSVGVRVCREEGGGPGGGGGVEGAGIEARASLLEEPDARAVSNVPHPQLPIEAPCPRQKGGEVDGGVSRRRRQCR